MMSIVRDYQKFREWAEALAKDNPHGIGESLIEYADAWDRDLKMLRAFQQIAEDITRATAWRPASKPPSNSAPVLIVDEDGEVDIACWRACKDNLDAHWHYWRGICTEAVWWTPLPGPPEQDG